MDPLEVDRSWMERRSLWSVLSTGIHRKLTEEDGYKDLHLYLSVKNDGNVKVHCHLFKPKDDGKPDPNMSYESPCISIEHITKLGDLIGINKSICCCKVIWHSDLDEIMLGPINERYYPCLQSIYTAVSNPTLP